MRRIRNETTTYQKKAVASVGEPPRDEGLSLFEFQLVCRAILKRFMHLDEYLERQGLDGRWTERLKDDSPVAYTTSSSIHHWLKHKLYQKDFSNSGAGCFRHVS